MKFISVALIFLFTSYSFAETFVPEGIYTTDKYTWCNHPLGNSEAACWIYGWNQVDLNKVVEINVEKLQQVRYFTIKDSFGQEWSANFEICNNNSIRCNANYSSDKKSLRIEFGDIDDSLTVILSEGEVTLFVWKGSQEAYIVFDSIKN